jgi:hypothetical protein
MTKRGVDEAQLDKREPASAGPAGGGFAGEAPPVLPWHPHSHIHTTRSTCTLLSPSRLTTASELRKRKNG